MSKNISACFCLLYSAESQRFNKEDIYNVETILYNLNISRSNLTEELTDTPAESLIRVKVEKNNCLSNAVLNYRRSVLHLTGTGNSGINDDGIKLPLLYENQTEETMKRNGMQQYEEDEIKPPQLEGEDFAKDSNDSLKTVKERDRLIQDYQLQDMIRIKNTQHQMGIDGWELLKLRSHYTYLKKLFLVLAVLNIILILCVVSVLPVILATFKLSTNQEVKSDDDIKQIASEQLSSSEGERTVSSFVFCVACSSLDERLSKFFSESMDERCCIKNIVAVFKVIFILNEQTSDECYSRFNGFDVKQQQMQFDISDLLMANFNTSNVKNKPKRPKHPGIQKNNELINTLLTRSRSAIHMYGKVDDGRMQWTAEMSEGKLSYNKHGISVDSGGMYFVYSVIRYKIDTCRFDRIIGYEVKQRGSLGSSVTIASVQKHCLNGTSFDHEFIVQKVFKLPVGQNSLVFIDFGEFSQSFIAKDHEHFFGIFEI